MRKYPIFLGVVLVVGSLSSCGGRALPAEMPVSTPSPLLERPLPDMSPPTMSGDRLDVDALSGSVVVVKFFARYCRPCQRTLPEAQALRDSSDDVLVVGVSLDENVSDVLEQISRCRLSFPVIRDRGRLLTGRGPLGASLHAGTIGPTASDVG